MVRAIFIDPFDREVSETRVPDVWHDLRTRYDGAKLIRAAHLPSGDAVYVAEELSDACEAFRLGGSQAFGGFGLILGRKGQFGLLSDAVVGCGNVAKLTTFCRRPGQSVVGEEVCEVSNAPCK
ncbi:hypothetical protein [Bradyrhizobium sp. S3.5.5]|uniref:hypothetical protein n=1 Tax=Bradyrhizobium sp. S3.5.5 TaxID=3156430 RepID=UPI0033915CF3